MDNAFLKDYLDVWNYLVIEFLCGLRMIEWILRCTYIFLGEVGIEEVGVEEEGIWEKLRTSLWIKNLLKRWVRSFENCLIIRIVIDLIIECLKCLEWVLLVLLKKEFWAPFKWWDCFIMPISCFSKKKKMMVYVNVKFYLRIVLKIACLLKDGFGRAFIV